MTRRARSYYKCKLSGPEHLHTSYSPVALNDMDTFEQLLETEDDIFLQGSSRRHDGIHTGQVEVFYVGVFADSHRNGRNHLHYRRLYLGAGLNIVLVDELPHEHHIIPQERWHHNGA